MKALSTKIGMAIMNARMKASLTRKETAGKVGLSESWLYQIEKNGRAPAADVFTKIAVELGTTERRLNNAAKKLEQAN